MGILHPPMKASQNLVFEILHEIVISYALYICKDATEHSILHDDTIYKEAML